MLTCSRLALQEYRNLPPHEQDRFPEDVRDVRELEKDHVIIICQRECSLSDHLSIDLISNCLLSSFPSSDIDRKVSVEFLRSEMEQSITTIDWSNYPLLKNSYLENLVSSLKSSLEISTAAKNLARAVLLGAHLHHNIKPPDPRPLGITRPVQEYDIPPNPPVDAVDVFLRFSQVQAGAQVQASAQKTEHHHYPVPSDEHDE